MTPANGAAQALDLNRYAALFQSEAREHLEALDAALLALEKLLSSQGAGQHADVIADDQVTVLFRSLHTIKGMAGAMAYTNVERVAHGLESHCAVLRESKRPPDDAFLALLFDGTSILRSAIDECTSAPAEAGAADGVEVPPLHKPPPTPAARRRPVGTPRTLRIEAARLDSMLDLVGELVIVRDHLSQATESTAHTEREVRSLVRENARLVSALQQEVLKARLQPASVVFDRFPRLIRDVARDLGKEVNFLAEGREMELDRSLLDAIAEPLMHLLRNALDHGLEMPAVREAAGKSPRGELLLRVARERDSIVFQVQDDGAGIDRQKVLARARQQGLVGPDVSELSDGGLLDIVAHPGFSTNSDVTALSGRGVGVDIVLTRVRTLGGSAELETVAGVGTVFTLRLPASLAIGRALLVLVGSAVYAIHTSITNEVVPWRTDAMSLAAMAQTQASITLRDDVIPVLALSELFGDTSSSGKERNVTDADTPDMHVVVVDTAGRRVGLLVDGIVGQQEIVIKPLHVVRGAKRWFSGATILGDGSPALIVDVVSVVQEAMGNPLRSGIAGVESEGYVKAYDGGHNGGNNDLYGGGFRGSNDMSNT